MDQSTIKLLQEHADLEAKAENFYKNGANWANRAGWLGSADYCHAEAKNEGKHWKAFIHLIRDVADVMPSTASLPALNTEYGSLKEFFEDVLALELKVEESLEHLAEVGGKLVTAFCNEFIRGQIETIRTVKDIIRLLVVAADDPCALLVVDKKVKKLA